MSNFPPKDAWPGGININKGGLSQFFADRVEISVANPAELNSMNTIAAGRFWVASLAALFVVDTADATSLDDGLYILVSGDGYRYKRQASATRKNSVINGGLEIWHRGASFAGADGYTADRWYLRNGPGVTVSRQGGAGARSCRVQRDSGNTSTATRKIVTAFRSEEHTSELQSH